MALPVTISGISTAANTVGPFKVAAGNYPAAAIDTNVTANSAFGIAQTGGVDRLGQSITNAASSLTIGSITASLISSGTPTGDVYAEIRDSFVGTLLATSSVVAVSSITSTNLPGQTTTFTFSSPPTISASATFAVVFRQTVTNSIAGTIQVVGGPNNYAGGLLSLGIGASSWSDQAANDVDLVVNSIQTVASDTFYFLGRDGTTANLLKAMKATDPTSSFSSTGTAPSVSFSAPNTIEQISAYQVGNLIHIIYCIQGTTNTSNYVYTQYNMATDTFLASSETIASGLTSWGDTIGGGSAAGCYGCSVVVRSTGEAVVFFNGLQTKVAGSFGSRVYYSRRTAVNTWSAAVQVDGNGGNANYVAPEAVLGVSDLVHFLFKSYSSGCAQRALSAANALQTQTSLNSAGIGLASFMNAVSYNDAGTTRIVHVLLSTNNTGPTAFRFTSIATPTFTTTSIDAGSVSNWPVRPFLDGTTVYAVYRNNTDGDLYVRSSADNGATWSSATNIFTGTVAAADANLSVDGAIYTRGNVVIPYIVNDGGTLKYNEYTVRTLGTANSKTITFSQAETVTQTRLKAFGKLIPNINSPSVVSVPGKTKGKNPKINSAELITAIEKRIKGLYLVSRKWIPRTITGSLLNFDGCALDADGSVGVIADFGSTGGFIYTSNDYGATWTQRTAPGAGNWTLAIAISADGTKIAVGANTSSIWTSTDTGVNWTDNSNSSGIKGWGGACCSEDGSVLYAAEFTTGIIYKSTNWGVSWNATNISGWNWNQICCSSDGVIVYGVLAANGVFKSSNGGANYNFIAVPSSAGLSHIACSFDGKTIITGSYQVGTDYLNISRNGGTTWEQVTQLGIGRWIGVSCSADGRVMYTGNIGGTVYSSNDAGVTWTQENDPGSTTWCTACSDDGDRVLIVSDDNTSSPWTGKFGRLKTTTIKKVGKTTTTTFAELVTLARSFVAGSGGATSKTLTLVSSSAVTLRRSITYLLSMASAQVFADFERITRTLAFASAQLVREVEKVGKLITLAAPAGPPTFVSSTSTVFNTTATPKTTASIAVQNGDVLVASGMCEIAFTTVAVVLSISTASGSTSAWSLQADTPFADINHAYLRTWTATATATGNITVSFAQTAGGSKNFGGTVAVFRGSGGIGNKNTANNNVSSGAPTISVTTSGDNSALVYASSDWNATNGAPSFTASNGTPVADLTDQTTATVNYCNYSSHVVNAGAAGSKTMGMDFPITQRYIASIVEVLGSGSGASQLVTLARLFQAGAGITNKAITFASVQVSALLRSPRKIINVAIGSAQVVIDLEKAARTISFVSTQLVRETEKIGKLLTLGGSAGAITQTGSTLRFESGNGNAGTVSSTITVPADAEFVVVGWSSYSTTANFFSTGGMTFTKGGVDTAMTPVSGGDSDTSKWMGAIFYLALPDTGPNKTLKWDWLGSSLASDNSLCSVTFWKGIDTSSPVRDSKAAQASALPYTTATITALSGDLILAWVALSVGVEATIDSWSNLSLLSQLTAGSSMDAAWGTGSPTGNTTVAALTGTNCLDGSIVAISLKPAATGGFSQLVTLARNFLAGAASTNKAINVVSASAVTLRKNMARLVSMASAQVFADFERIGRTISFASAQATTLLRLPQKIINVVIGSVQIVIDLEKATRTISFVSTQVVTAAKGLSFKRTITTASSSVVGHLRSTNRFVSVASTQLVTLLRSPRKTINVALGMLQTIIDLERAGRTISFVSTQLVSETERASKSILVASAQLVTLARNFLSGTVNTNKAITFVSTSAVTLTKSIATIVSAASSQVVTLITAAVVTTIKTINMISGSAVTLSKRIVRLVSLVSAQVLALLKTVSKRLTTAGDLAQIVTLRRSVSHLVNIVEAQLVTLSRRLLHAVSMVSAQLVTLARLAANNRLITVATSQLVTLTRNISKALSFLSGQVVTKIAAIPRIVNILSAQLVTLATVFQQGIQSTNRAINIVSASTVSLFRNSGRTINMTLVQVPALLKTMAKPISAIGSQLVTLSRRAVRTLTLSNAQLVTLNRLFAYLRTFSIAQAQSVTLTNLKSFLRTISVASAELVSLTKRNARTITMASAEFVTVNASKAFLRTLAFAQTQLVTLSDAISYLRTVSLTQTQTVTLTRIRAILKTISITSAELISVARSVVRRVILTTSELVTLNATKAFLRTISIVQAQLVTLTKLTAFRRILSLSQASAVSLTKLISRTTTFTQELLVTSTRAIGKPIIAVQNSVVTLSANFTIKVVKVVRKLINLVN